MTGDFKKCLKLLKYDKDFIPSVVTMILFLICTTIGYVVGKKGKLTMPSLFMMMAFMQLVQLAYSLCYSGMIGTSPKRAMLEKKLIDVIIFFGSMVSYLIMTLVTLIKINLGVVEKKGVITGLFLSYILIAIVPSYPIVWTKKPFLGAIIFFFSYYIIMLLGLNDHFKISLGLGTTLVFGLFTVMLGFFVSSVLRRTLYKLPIKRYYESGKV